MLGGHPAKDEAWKHVSHSEKILKLLSLQTKNTKAKTPAQMQQWLGKMHDTR